MTTSLIKNISGFSGVFTLILLWSGYPVVQPLNAQIDTTDAGQVEDYNWRIMQRMLNGIYIPQDIDDAIEELKENSSEAALSRFRSAPEEDISRRLFFGLGRWMKSNWQLYEGSRFSHYLRQKGLSHPDDMVTFMIESLHRHLNDRELEVEKRIKELREERFKILRRMQERDTIRVDTIKK